MSIATASEVSVWFRSGLLRRKNFALNNFSLKISSGKTTGLIGPNGAGKTTAMLGFLGLIRPNEGTFKLNGSVPVRGSDDFSDVAYLPEEACYPEYLTVREALKSYSTYTPVQSESNLTDLLEYYELNEHADRQLESCSKGLKQRFGLATLMLGDPKIIFLDEPTRGLDPLIVEKLVEWLRTKQSEEKTIVMNSHVLSDVEMLCDEVVLLEDGRVKTHEPLDKLLEENAGYYTIKLRASCEWPDYAEVVEETGEEIIVSIPTDKFVEFARFCREQNTRIVESKIQRKTLLDVMEEEVVVRS